MRFRIFAAVGLMAALFFVSDAFAQTGQRRAPPKINETQDADTKAEYLESIPYKPCPASVRFPNGQHACLGLPGQPKSDVEGANENRSGQDDVR
jgi:hypothetical protein